jgi:hypothetical protein
MGAGRETSMTFKTVLVGAVLALTAVAPAYAEDLVFKLNNKSSGAVNELYVSPLDANTWEEDILGQDVLDAGKTATITIHDANGQCEWDVRIVYDDGSVTDERKIDLCHLANGTYDVTD